MVKKKTQSTDIQLPSVLSFERKLETSDGFMYSGVWGDDPRQFTEWQKIKITQRQNRSTQSSYKTSEAKKAQPNPVSSNSDDANLAAEHDTLKLSFSTRIIGNLGIPFACNNPEFQKAIIEKTKDYKDSENVSVLANRYAYNIANGRFLWRNRVGAEEVKVIVRSNELDQPLIFDAYDFSLKNFDTNSDNEDLNKLKDAIQKGLSGDDQSFQNLEIEAYVKLGKSQHVFPSQEMNMGEKAKRLFQLENCAAIHNVKIGNAIRTIDNWYDNAQFPIAAEPFGAVTQIGEAFRKSNNDFYTLMLSWINGEDITAENQSYIVANLIRGGVFGAKSE